MKSTGAFCIIWSPSKVMKFMFIWWSPLTERQRWGEHKCYSVNYCNLATRDLKLWCWICILYLYIYRYNTILVNRVEGFHLRQRHWVKILFFPKAIAINSSFCFFFSSKFHPYYSHLISILIGISNVLYTHSLQACTPQKNKSMYEDCEMTLEKSR